MPRAFAGYLLHARSPFAKPMDVSATDHTLCTFSALLIIITLDRTIRNRHFCVGKFHSPLNISTLQLDLSSEMLWVPHITQPASATAGL
jgi:hypothetical protein